MAFELKIKIEPVDPLIRPLGFVPPPNPLGPLAELPGTWIGTGFNQIWRPFHPTTTRAAHPPTPRSDRFWASTRGILVNAPVDLNQCSRPRFRPKKRPA